MENREERLKANPSIAENGKTVKHDINKWTKILESVVSEKLSQYENKFLKAKKTLR